MPDSRDHATIRLNRIAIPVGNLGYGRRAVIWVQGCTIACPGCISRHTWNRKGGEVMMVTELAELIQLSEMRSGPLDGVTITGGEPSEQAGAVRNLIRLLRGDSWLGGARDVLLYSGREWTDLVRLGLTEPELFDAVIAGPYVNVLPRQTLAGSSNQRLVPLTPLGALRYCDGSDSPAPLEGVWDGDHLLLAGISSPAEHAQFRKLLAENGIGMR